MGCSVSSHLGPFSFLNNKITKTKNSETLKSQTFNASTDIFAFAMTMIEIWTDGDTPFVSFKK